MICCRNVRKSFQGNTVLQDIHLSIQKGEIFGLLGPSGAGKTTLIKILTGQLSFDRGNVNVFEKEVCDLSGEDKKKIGIMMDQFGVYERLSCADNLKIYADIYGIPKDRVPEILKEVGLEKATKTLAGDLSKGMRARLQLARVFMHSPDILFLDEPTSGLDPQSMKAIHHIITEKKKAGCTIFLTTHNMEEAYVLCDQVALLNDGIIVEKGRPEEICRKYNHQKKIKIHLSSGEDVEFDQNKECVKAIYELMQSGELETIHSSEPTLETVFLELTGRNLKEEM